MKNGRECVKSLTAVLQLVVMMLVHPSGTAANTLVHSDVALPPIVQNDIAIEPDGPFAGPIRPVPVALLLPLRSPMLAQAAAAVRDGFLAALRYQSLQAVMVSLEIVETSDSVADHLAQYGRAELNNHLIIGPLTRTAVAALAPVLTQTTIALAPAANEQIGGAKAVTNKSLAPIIAIGLSIEEEARQLAEWANRCEERGVAWIVSTEAPWQQRAAHAFMQQLQAQGRRATVVNVDVISGVLNPDHLSALREKIHDNPPALLFFALDFRQAVQLREALGVALPAYGTSQLNPFNAAQWQQAKPAPQLEGVRLLDLPSRLYDQDLTIFNEQQTLPPATSADLDRLQSLGHDAFLVMQQLLRGRTHFSIDGQTGSLSINIGPGSAARFARNLKPAVYEEGRVIIWREGQ